MLGTPRRDRRCSTIFLTDMFFFCLFIFHILAEWRNIALANAMSRTNLCVIFGKEGYKLHPPDRIKFISEY